MIPVTKNVSSDDEASKALDILLAALAKTDPAARAHELARIEIALDNVRARTDAERGAPLDVKQARSLRRWARIAAFVLEQDDTLAMQSRGVDERLKTSTRGALKRLAPIVDAPATSAATLRAIIRIVEKYANWPGDVSTQASKIAASLAHTLKAEIAIDDAAALLLAWRRKRGQRSSGEPSKAEALFGVLRPLDHAQSIDAVKQALKRTGRMR